MKALETPQTPGTRDGAGRESDRARGRDRERASRRTPEANLRTKILDFRGFYSIIILLLMGGILTPKVNFPGILIQQILASGLTA